MTELIENVEEKIIKLGFDPYRVNEHSVRILLIFAEEGNLDGLASMLKKAPSIAKDVSESLYSALLLYCEKYKETIDKQKRIEAVTYILENALDLAKSIDNSMTEREKFNKKMIVLVDEMLLCKEKQ